MTLLIRHSPANAAERNYIYQTIFGDFLGLSWRSIVEERPDVCIELQDDYSGRCLTTSDLLLKLADAEWLQASTLPQQPLAWWDPPGAPPFSAGQHQPVPVLYGQPACTLRPDRIALGIDLFGSCFYLLSRYEEAVKPDLDRHGRFPASASLAVQENFLDRPLVNEYTDILWTCLSSLWPSLSRRPRQFRTIVTADVDRPLTCSARTLVSTVRKLGRDVIKDRSPRQAAASLRLHLDHRAGRYHKDPFMTFDWMLRQCEEAGHRATFNFICAHTSNAYDGCYRLDEPFIRELLRTVHARGHEIGLHGSYNSYLDAGQLGRETTLLRSALDHEGIAQTVLGARQHYLRWRTPDTARFLDAAQIAYDSTLAFADRPGFRCGTCFEYPLYDLVERRALRVRERPLIVMEASVMSASYMGLGRSEQALQLMLDLKNTCRRVHGDFVLLWHNSELTTHLDRELYRTLLAA